MGSGKIIFIYIFTALFSEIISKYKRKTGRSISSSSRHPSFGNPTDNRFHSGYSVTSRPVMGSPGPSATVGVHFPNHGLYRGAGPIVPQSGNYASGNIWNIPSPIDVPPYDSMRNDPRQSDSMTPNVHESWPYKVDDIEMNEISTSFDSTDRKDPGTLSFLEGYVRGDNHMLSLGGQSEFGSLANTGPPVQMLRSDSIFPGQKHALTESYSHEEQDRQEFNHQIDDATKKKVEEWLKNVDPGSPEEPKYAMPQSRGSTDAHRTMGATGKHKLSQSDENGGPSKKFSSARDNNKRGKLSSKSYMDGVKQEILGNHETLEALHGRERTTLQPIAESLDRTPDTHRVRSTPGLASKEQEQTPPEQVNSDPTMARCSFVPHIAVRSKHHSWPESRQEELNRRKKDIKKIPNNATQQMYLNHPRSKQAQNEHCQNMPRSTPKSPAPVSQGHGQSEDMEFSSVETRHQPDVEQILRQFKAMSVSMPDGLKPATHKEGKKLARS